MSHRKKRSETCPNRNMKTGQVWKSWRDEQCARAAAERRERREARTQQLWKTWGRPMKTTNKEITTQLSTHTSPTAKSLTTLPMPKPPKDKTGTVPRYKSDELTDPRSTGA